MGTGYCGLFICVTGLLWGKEGHSEYRVIIGYRGLLRVQRAVRGTGSLWGIKCCWVYFWELLLATEGC